MTDSAESWLVIIFLVLVDVIFFYSLPGVQALIVSKTVQLILEVAVAVGNILGLVWVFS